jgi:two-component system sensor histidine kinase BarA
VIGPSQIRRQILTVALVPALLIALVMAAFYLHTRLESLDESMHQRIHAVAEGLASTSEFARFSGDVSYLRNLGVIESLESNSDFQVGMLRDNDGQVLIEWGAQEAWQIPLDRLPTVEGQLPVDDDLHLVFHHPVSVSPAAIDTPLSLENAPARATDERRQLGWVTLQFSREALVAERDAIIFKSMLITLGGLLLGGLLAFRMSTTLSERMQPCKAMARWASSSNASITWHRPWPSLVSACNRRSTPQPASCARP